MELAGAKNPLLSGLTDGLKKFTHHLTHHKILAGRRGFKCNFPHFPLLTFFGYVKFEVETGASPGWSPMVIYKGALVNIWLKG